MYKIHPVTNAIHCDDGYVIPPPYDDPRYLDYAEWVTGGNNPEMIPVSDLPPVPNAITRFQARAMLLQAGLLDTIEAFMVNETTPRIYRLAWQDAQEFYRDSPLILTMAGIFSLSEEQLDNMFRQAVLIKV